MKLKHKDIFELDSQIHIAKTVFRSNKEFARHQHDFFEFFLITKGSMLHNLNGITKTIKQKSIVFIKPEDTHSFKKVKNCKELEIINIAFLREEYLKAFKFLYGENRNKKSLQSVYENILPEIWNVLFSKISLLSTHNSFTNLRRDTFFTSLLIDVIILLIRDSENNCDIPAWLHKSVTELSINSNYIAGLQKFVKLANRSQEHLTRSMKKFYGVTPTEFINSLRIQEASKLLMITDLTISTIAYQVGFNNMPYFLTQFKKYLNCTPSKFRRANKDNYYLELN